MDLENFGGANTLLCIDFLKLWGGQWPSWPPRFRRPWNRNGFNEMNQSYYIICGMYFKNIPFCNKIEKSNTFGKSG